MQTVQYLRFNKGHPAKASIMHVFILQKLQNFRSNKGHQDKS